MRTWGLRSKESLASLRQCPKINSVSWHKFGGSRSLEDAAPLHRMVVPPNSPAADALDLVVLQNREMHAELVLADQTAVD